ncbi:MAG: precorrin-6A/cobalt-precorrin-6A reductase, partial [Mangrovicoccus sp.]
SALPATKLRPDCRFTLRAMTALDGPLPPHVSYCQSRPGSEAEEGIFLRKQGFTHLIAKNSGGPSRGKIDAAQKLGLPITMISRPPLPKGPIFQRVEDILAWLAPHLSATKGRA